MGTLFDQPPRKTHDYDPELWLARINRLAGAAGMTVTEVCRALEVAELRRRNDLQASDNDIRDEQQAGFGELLQELTRALGREAA